MRILMLGNSFTYYHDMPKMLSATLGCEVVAHTRGGARLSEHLNPETELGARTLPALRDEKWDFVVLQEQSNAPVTTKKVFHESVKKLTGMICAAGAVPVLYATWAYKENTEKLATMNMTYDEMFTGLYQSYHEAVFDPSVRIADVGLTFSKLRGLAELYEEDAFHPSEAGSILAAQVIAQTILQK